MTTITMTTITSTIQKTKKLLVSYRVVDYTVYYDHYISGDYRYNSITDWLKLNSIKFDMERRKDHPNVLFFYIKNTDDYQKVIEGMLDEYTHIVRCGANTKKQEKYFYKYTPYKIEWV